MINISLSHMSNIETGSTNFGVDILVRLAEALQVSTNALLRPDVPQGAMLYAKEIDDLLCGRTPEMWIRCNILSVFVRTFHNLGLLQCITIYLYHEKNVRYMDFYEALIAWVQDNPESVLGKQHRWLSEKYTEILAGDGSLTCTVPQFGDLTWPLEQGVFLHVVLDYDTFYAQLTAFF